MHNNNSNKINWIYLLLIAFKTCQMKFHVLEGLSIRSVTGYNYIQEFPSSHFGNMHSKSFQVFFLLFLCVLLPLTNSKEIPLLFPLYPFSPQNIYIHYLHYSLKDNHYVYSTSFGSSKIVSSPFHIWCFISLSQQMSHSRCSVETDP